MTLSAAAGCDMSSSRRGHAERSVASAIERAAAIEAAAAQPTQSAAPAQPAMPGSAPGATRVVGIPEGAPKVDARGITEATFDDVKFEMVKTDKFERSMLTPKVQSLFDKRIRIRGYMYPDDAPQGTHPVRAGARQHGMLLRPRGGAVRLHLDLDGAGEDGGVLDPADRGRRNVPAG